MTKVVRWAPMNPANLFNEFDRLFERPVTRSASEWNVALDVAENDDAYLVKATVPGINPDGLRGGTINPASPTIRAASPTSVATTGSPLAIASTSGCPKVSR